MQSTVRASSPLPLYFKVRMDIQEKILSGEWPTGSQIPGEVDLAKDLGVSVITVRQALGQLVQEGYIHRERARGSFVSWNGPLRQAVQFDVEVGDLLTLKGEVRFQLIGVEKVNPTEAIKKGLCLSRDEKPCRVNRVRFLGGQPVEYVISYLSEELIHLIPEAELGRLPIPNAIEAFAGIKISSVRHTVGAVLADAHVAEHLEIPTGSPVLLIDRDYLSKAEIVTVSIGYSRSDLFRYELELRRRSAQ